MLPAATCPAAAPPLQGADWFVDSFDVLRAALQRFRVAMIGSGGWVAGWVLCGRWVGTVHCAFRRPGRAPGREAGRQLNELENWCSGVRRCLPPALGITGGKQGQGLRKQGQGVRCCQQRLYKCCLCCLVACCLPPARRLGVQRGQAGCGQHAQRGPAAGGPVCGGGALSRG